MPLVSMGAQEEKLFAFDYMGFLAAWRRVMKRLPFEAVPYQARHSGASLDAARSYRSRKEIMERGRWQSQSSLVRYEKHATVAQSLNCRSPMWRAQCEISALRQEAMFFADVAPGTLTLPEITKSTGKVNTASSSQTYLAGQAEYEKPPPADGVLGRTWVLEN